MQRNSLKYGTYVRILEEELIPAMGCTEPIALAYAAAEGRKTLGTIPKKIHIQVSGSIIKNVKSVIVPHTNKLKGIKTMVATGVIAGDADKKLEVLSSVSDDKIPLILDYLKSCPITIEPIDYGHIFDIIITEYSEDSYSKIRIVDFHTNVVLIEKDGEILFEQPVDKQISSAKDRADRNLLSVEGIWDFVNSVDISDIKNIIDKQIQYNSAIAEEGLHGQYGSNIGRLLMELNGDNVSTRASAKAAAASDARMNGCELPVVINAGSGNQGITCSIPVIEYAKELKSSEDKLYRALVLSNLISIHEKTGIGTLSAYCGAVSAGAGSGAGIAYLYGSDYDIISHTVVNTLAIVSGMVCDGAKASCAAKISSAVGAGILAYHMAKKGQNFHSGDGLVMSDVEATIQGIGRLSREGMKETNEEIIKLMIDN